MINTNNKNLKIFCKESLVGLMGLQVIEQLTSIKAFSFALFEELRHGEQ